MIEIKKIVIDKPSGFGKVDTVLPGESTEVDELMKSVTDGTLIIATYIKPLMEWFEFLKNHGKDPVIITGKTRKRLGELIKGGIIIPKVVLATDTITYGTSFNFYHTEILLDIPWSRGKLLQRIYRIIRRGSEYMDKKIYLIGTKQKFERIEKKLGFASLVEHVRGFNYEGAW